MRVTAEEGYLKKLKDDGSIFVGRCGDHVQAYLFQTRATVGKKFPTLPQK